MFWIPCGEPVSTEGPHRKRQVWAETVSLSTGEATVGPSKAAGGGAEEQLNSRCIFKVESTGGPDGLLVHHKEKKRNRQK